MDLRALGEGRSRFAAEDIQRVGTDSMKKNLHFLPAPKVDYFIATSMSLKN
jgi:hypothetical protein